MSETIPTYEADAIDLLAAQERSTPLDECAKKIMSSREIIARVLRAVVPEYKGVPVKDILPLIGVVSIDKINVNADQLPPKVVSEGTEDSTVTEGKRFYDIKFTAKLPDTEQELYIIINLEIQNKYSPGYKLIKRAVFYAARLISSQLNTVFKKEEYDKIQKVYSIWICTSPPEKLANTISHYYLQRRSILGKVSETDEDREDYRIPNIIMIHLGKSDTKDCDGIIRMLYTLLASEQTAQEKKDIIHNEYGVPMDEEFDKEVDYMCNISSMYIDRGIQKGIDIGMAQGMEQGVEKGEAAMILKMHRSGMSPDAIAKIAEQSLKDIEKIIAENSQA